MYTIIDLCFALNVKFNILFTLFQFILFDNLLYEVFVVLSTVYNNFYNKKAHLRAFNIIICQIYQHKIGICNLMIIQKLALQ